MQSKYELGYELVKSCEIDFARTKLQEVKRKGISLIAVDYDGTICGNGINEKSAAALVGEIIRAGVIPAIVTARDATIRRAFLPYLKEQLTDPKHQCYFAPANGATLELLSNAGTEVIHSHDLSVADAAYIADCYSFLGIKGSVETVTVLRDLGTLDWSDVLSEQQLHISYSHPGVWVESAKICLALPEEQRQRLEAVQKLSEMLSSRFFVAYGGQGYADVTKSLSLAPKRFALERVLQDTGVALESVVAFGDTPAGNDRELLDVPYGFTNDPTFVFRPHASPYKLLVGSGGSVLAVHEAIRFLLDN